MVRFGLFNINKQVNEAIKMYQILIKEVKIFDKKGKEITEPIEMLKIFEKGQKFIKKNKKDFDKLLKEEEIDGIKYKVLELDDGSKFCFTEKAIEIMNNIK
jgi:hypothetical protein